MKKSKYDVWVGLFVLVGVAALLFLSLKSANLRRERPYNSGFRFNIADTPIVFLL